MKFFNQYRRQSFLLLFVLMCIQGFSLWGIVSRGNTDFVINIIETTAFWFAYTMLEQIKGIRINLYIRVAAILAIIGDSFFGLFLNLYVTSQAFDRIQHIFGSYALALLFYALMLQFTRQGTQDGFKRFIFVAAIGVSAGAVYEIMEYLSDSLLRPQIPNQPSLQDTDLDLVSDLAGALIAGIHAVLQSSLVETKQ